MALYGHPDAGGYWERRFESHLKKIGFTPIPEWQRCFWHPKYEALLVVYVDDFKLAGPKKHVEELWKRIKEGLTIRPSGPAGIAPFGAGKLATSSGKIRFTTSRWTNAFFSASDISSAWRLPGKTV